MIFAFRECRTLFVVYLLFGGSGGWDGDGRGMEGVSRDGERRFSSNDALLKRQICFLKRAVLSLFLSFMFS